MRFIKAKISFALRNLTYDPIVNSRISEYWKPTLKEPTPTGGRVAITGGRLQIKDWLLRYQDGGDFTVKVLLRYRPLQALGLAARLITQGA